MATSLTNLSFAALALFGALSLEGCAHQHSARCACDKPAAASAGVKAPGEATIGDKTTCPVSGEEFTVAATSPTATVEGKTYYFCCPGCDKKFVANPASFLKK